MIEGCPFCGGEARFYGDTSLDDGPVWALSRMWSSDDEKFDASVECCRCGATVSAVGSSEDAAIANAIQKWNMRTKIGARETEQ